MRRILHAERVQSTTITYNDETNAWEERIWITKDTMEHADIYTTFIRNVESPDIHDYDHHYNSNIKLIS